MLNTIPLQHLVNALDAHAIVSVSDMQGNITYFNDKFAEISQYSSEELLGQNHRLLKSGMHPESFYDAMWDTISRGEIWHGEICNRKKDGTHYWVSSTIYPMLDENRLATAYISIRTDITHVKHTENQLDLLAHMVENTAEPIFMIDVAANYRLSYVNQAACKHWGTNKEELLTWRLPDWDPNFDEARTAAHFAETVDKPGVLIETQHKLKDGRVVPVDVFANARMIADKPYVFGSFQNVSERKKNEDALNLFRRIFESTDQAIWIADKEGHLTYINPAHERLCRCTLSEVAGKHYSVFLTKEALNRASAIIDTLFNGDNWAGLLPLKRSDDSEFMSACHFGTLMESDGNPQYFFNVAYDYTEELNRQEELREARDKAASANQAKSKFLSSMNHELRTPMNAIIGFGQLMEQDNALSEENKDYVQEILKAGDHLLELINEVLDLAKVESGRMSLSLEAIEVCPVIMECLNLMKPLAAQRQIKISHRGMEGMTVQADRMRFKQVVLNLLSNAIKYNREGGSVQIEVRPSAKDRLCIRVTDTGHGISEEKQTGLFQPFNRLDAEHSDIEGTGIGLSITRHIVELMGGIINVRSETGVGSTFWIELATGNTTEFKEAQDASGDSGLPDMATTHTKKKQAA